MRLSPHKPRPESLAPWISLALLITVVVVLFVYITQRKRWKQLIKTEMDETFHIQACSDIRWKLESGFSVHSNNCKVKIHVAA